VTGLERVWEDREAERLKSQSDAKLMVDEM